MKLRFVLIRICLLVNLLFLACQSSKESAVSENPNETSISRETELEMKQAEESPSYNEQIACKPVDCIEINYNKYSELDDKIYDLLGQSSGRILIKMKSFNYKLEDKFTYAYCRLSSRTFQTRWKSFYRTILYWAKRCT